MYMSFSTQNSISKNSKPGDDLQIFPGSSFLSPDSSSRFVTNLPSSEICKIIVVQICLWKLLFIGCLVDLVICSRFCVVETGRNSNYVRVTMCVTECKHACLTWPSMKPGTTFLPLMSVSCSMCVCTHACMHACMYLSYLMYASMYACVCSCLCECACVLACVHVMRCQSVSFSFFPLV